MVAWSCNFLTLLLKYGRLAPKDNELFLLKLLSLSCFGRRASGSGHIRAGAAVSHFLFKNLITVIFGGTIYTTGHAQLTTVAEDNFNYSNGSALAGQNGGSGWTSVWINDYTSGATLDVSTTGLTYPGLPSGGSAVWGSGGNGISEDSRALPLQDSGLLYIQFLCKFGSSSGGGTPNIRLLDSGVLTGGFGGNGGTHGSVISILNTSLNPATDGSSSSTANLSAVNLVVGLINYQTDTTEMWINPNLSTFDYAAPSSPNATYAGLAPEFNDISIVSRSPATVSDLQVMTVPEPMPASLLGFGILLWGLRYYRR
jgi:hypothetical protein